MYGITEKYADFVDSGLGALYDKLCATYESKEVLPKKTKTRPASDTSLTFSFDCSLTQMLYHQQRLDLYCILYSIDGKEVFFFTNRS